MATTVEVLGLDHLQNKLSLLSSLDISSILMQAGLAVEAEAKELCPIDDGTLRASIKAEKVDDKTVKVGTNVEYAVYVHQGTGIYAKNGDGRQEPWSYVDAEGNWHTTKGQHPNPFLERALDNKKKEINEYVNQKVQEVLDK